MKNVVFIRNSCALDASLKIFTNRVNSLEQTAYKVLGELYRTQQKPDVNSENEEDEEDSDSTDEEVIPKQVLVKKHINQLIIRNKNRLYVMRE